MGGWVGGGGGGAGAEKADSMESDPPRQRLTGAAAAQRGLLGAARAVCGALPGGLRPSRVNVNGRSYFFVWFFVFNFVLNFFVVWYFG